MESLVLSARFGAVSFDLETRTEGGVLRIDARWRGNGAPRLLIHIPEEFNISAARAGGVNLEQVKSGAWVAPPDAKRVDFDWIRTPDETPMSYERAVEEYLRRNVNGRS